MNKTRALAALFVLCAWRAGAQYQTPTLDGVVSGGEYAHSSGNWSMTWDATYLYVAKTNLSNTNNGVLMYLDIDPQSTSPTAGSNSNGNITGTTDFSVTASSLPFRADARVLGIPTSPDIKSRDGSGGWGSANSSSADITEATNGTTRELRIRWASLPGLSAIPSPFRWFGYEASTNNMSDPMPSANGIAMGITQTSFSYAYSIASTADGGSTNPFSVQESTWYVTSTGSGLDSAITISNGIDTTSSRRYIVFNGISGNTITTSSDLSLITRTTTIDGTTAPGYSSTPVLVLRGFSTNISTDHGLRFSGCSGCVVRGLVLQNHGDGINIANGSGTSVVGNYVGTDTSGTGTSANNAGIRVTGCSSCTIGGTTAADRNLISGNTGSGIVASGTTSLTIEGNYIGTKANGIESLTNPIGINLSNAAGTLIGGTTSGANVITTTGDQSILIQNSDDVSVYGNLIGVGADGTTALGGGNGIYLITGSRLTIGAVTPSTAHNTIANLAASILFDQTTGISIRGNSMVSNDFTIENGGSVVQPPPTVSAAEVGGNTLYVTFSLTSSSTSAATQSMQLDLYDADTTAGKAAEGKLYRATSPCYSGSSLTNQQWTAGSGFAVGDKIVLIATSFSDANCTTPGDGSSTNTSTITTTALAGSIFTGPGAFSDTTKWNGGVLPSAGQDFTILNICTFDSNAPVRTYGKMILGNGVTSGTLGWPTEGNSVVLDVTDVDATNGTIDMSSAGTLRVRGNMTAGTTLIGGPGTIEFTGSGKTLTASSSSTLFHNVTVTGTLTIANTFYFDGTLDVQSGGSLSGSGSTIVYPRNGAAITGSGSMSFGQINIAAGMSVTASSSFSASSTFTVDGTFTPAATAVISGSGTLTGSGTVRITRTGSNVFGGQYTLNRSLGSLTVECAGTASQAISTALSVGNFTINNSSGVTIANVNITVANQLTLTSGITKNSGGGQISITNTSPSAISAVSGLLNNITLLWSFGTGSTTYTIPTGSSSGATPITVTVNSASVGGQLSVRSVQTGIASLSGGSGLDPSRDANVFWSIAFPSGTISSFDATFTFNSAIDAGATPSKFALRSVPENSNAFSDLPATPAATSISATGLTPSTDSVDYGMGNQLIESFVVSASSQQTAGIPFTTTVTAKDFLQVVVNDSSTVVTMTSNTGNAQYDSDGNGTFGDNTKTLTNGTFTISTKDNVAEGVTLTATEPNGKTGTSSNIDIIAKVFNGPGSFSDTSKWSGNALPNAGAAFVIRNACTFDNAAPVRAYGSMTIGDTIASGSISWQSGNSVVLDVTDVTVISGSPVAIDMTNGGTLRVTGNITVGASDFTAGNGTVKFAGNSTITSAGTLFHNVIVTGTAAIANTFYFDGTLTVDGTLSGSGSTTLYPRNGAAIVVGGTMDMGQINIEPGMVVTASGNFSASSTFTVDGTFTPSSSAVISGAGTIGGSGTVKVTGTATDSFSSQYSLNRDAPSLTVEYAGSSAQGVSGGTYKNLVLNNPVSGALKGNVTITGTLTLTSGALIANFDLLVTNSSTSAVVVTSGRITGSFTRAFATGTNTYSFPVGSTAISLPVSITVNAATVAGQLLVSATPANPSPGGSGVDSTKSVNGFWNVSFISGSIASYDVTFNFGAAIDAAADLATLVMRRTSLSGISWADVPMTATQTSITATGVSQSIGPTYRFVAGNQQIDHYVVSATSPQTAGTAFTTTVTAQDILNLTTNISGTVVTMTSNTTHAQFDSDGNGTFGDNTKSITNGTFTISTKDNTAESLTITATDGSSNTGTSSAITVTVGAASGSTTTISANPTSITADGTSTSTITVQAKDALGNSYTSNAGIVTLNTTLGTLSGVTNNNNGSYTATLTAGLQSGTATISGTIGGNAITATATVTFTTAAFGAPPSFTATATSTSQVSLSWAAVSGATSYEVYRSAFNSAYALISNTSSTSITDSSLSAGTSYIYKVRALNGTTPSAYSIDAATTIVFTDTVIASRTIRAVHITELRTAVNAMRAAAGLSSMNFTDTSLTGVTVKRLHLTELRTALDAARTTIGLPALTYTDSTITAGSTTIKSAHILELRTAVQ